ncbi:MAG: hypothetical protein CFE25_05415 [Chitinophagaceae bacterium BSSC1]|nr:MAG: hypothetical protein CFE25_05415 [Chitinophagaceae bacterium BSSC1]
MLWYDYLQVFFLILIWTLIILNKGWLDSNRFYWVLFFLVHTISELVQLNSMIRNKENLWVNLFRNPLQFLFLVIFFLKISIASKIRKLFVFICACLLCLVLIFLKKDGDYKTIDELGYSTAIICACIYYFYFFIISNNYIQLENSEFWFCSAVFVFFGVPLSINGGLAYLINHNLEFAQKLFYIIVFNTYIFYCIVLYAIYLNTKEKKFIYG